MYWLADSGSDECLWKEQPNWRLLSCVGTAMLSPGKPSGSRSACTLAVTLLERLKRARLQARRRGRGNFTRESFFPHQLALSSDDPPLAGRGSDSYDVGATRPISACENPLAYDTPACANVTSVIRVFTLLRVFQPPNVPTTRPTRRDSDFARYAACSSLHLPRHTFTPDQKKRSEVVGTGA